ncbi:MAG: hypothetical protein DRQ51_05310 [Gammaproteobacteria bacterium]|nr:MAG: hypothetical protein DRQ51_05310 [Gammaproteobacteria bacterium]
MQGYTYDYEIDWGDGTITHNNTDNANHTYDSAGLYTVKISGTFPGINSCLDVSKVCQSNYKHDNKIISVEQWGNQKWQTFKYAFARKWDVDSEEDLKINAIDQPDLSEVEDISRAFARVVNFNGDVSQWDVSNVTDISQMFSYAKHFNQDISGWDTSNVTNMADVFYGADSFNQDISKWNLSNVIFTKLMFYRAKAFNQDISDWDTSNVTNMENMFREAESFNQDLSGWNVDKVTKHADFMKDAGSSSIPPDFP